LQAAITFCSFTVHIPSSLKHGCEMRSLKTHKLC
jgi:hypothetical protein